MDPTLLETVVLDRLGFDNTGHSALEDESPDAVQVASLLVAARHYLDTFLHKRDAKGSSVLASARLTGFGTGAQEQVYSLAHALDLYQADIDAMPTPIHYSLKAIQAQPLGEQAGVVMGEMDWHFNHLSQSVALLNIRFSLVFCQQHGQWLLEHKHLSQPSQAQGNGEGYPLKELEERRAVLERLVQERTRDLEQTSQKLQQLAITDALTGLYNRVRTDEMLDLEIDLQTRQSSPLSVILMDIDHFKLINDRYGHRTGDRILVEVARLLGQRLRSTDCLGRWGGEEFLLICPNTSPTDARTLAEELRLSIEQESFGVLLDMTLSLGLAHYRPGDTRESIIERSDRALYQAKQAGRNRVSASSL